MFSDLGETPWLPQIDINAVETQGYRDYIGILQCSFLLSLAVDSSRRGSSQIHFSTTQYGKLS